MSTLIEKLRDIERLRAGSEWPQWMKDTCDWGGPLSALAKEAADRIEELENEIHNEQREDRP